jgi:hypothetical protein
MVYSLMDSLLLFRALLELLSNLEYLLHRPEVIKIARGEIQIIQRILQHFLMH